MAAAFIRPALAAAAAATAACAAAASPPGRISYGRDIRPLLSDRCFLCHGPDREKRQAGLRLDSFDDATAALASGMHAIVPGNPETSAILARMRSHDPKDAMPPQESGKRRLSDEEIDLIRRWIAEGAAYEAHWSFVPPSRPALPEVSDPGWCRNPVDRFVLARLEEAKLGPGPEADRATLARRAFLDLTGLPPTPEEIAAFEADGAPDAFDRLVDRLMQEEPYRSRFAERMAVPWMDLARYADTCGIHQDNGRQIWPWRDWVLEAYRTHMPYDRFVIEQLAGDLLPDATDSARVASGFNRNHVTSDEGGAISEEYLLEYAVDRVTTVGTAFMGLSMGCARCHDHKFDPVSMEDFYGLLAFFNSVEEPGIYSQTQDAKRAYEPYIDLPSGETRTVLEALERDIAAAEARRDAPVAGESEEMAAFSRSLDGSKAIEWMPSTVTAASSAGGATMLALSDGSVLVQGGNPDSDEHVIELRTDGRGLRLIALEALTHELLGGKVGRAHNGNAILDGISVAIAPANDPDALTHLPLSWAWADVEQTNDDFRAINAIEPGGSMWALAGHEIPGTRTALFLAERPFGFEGGTIVKVRLGYRSPYPQHVIGRPRVSLARITDAALERLPHSTGSWFIAGPFVAPTAEEAYAAARGPEAVRGIDRQARFAEQSWRYAPGVVEGTPVGLAQGVGSEFVAREIWSPSARTVELSLGSDDGIEVYVNGWRVHEHRIDRGVAPDQERVRIPLAPGRNALVCKVVNTGGVGGFYHREDHDASRIHRDSLALALPERMTDAGARDRARVSWRSHHSPAYAAARAELGALAKRRDDIRASMPRTMVMRERADPVQTHVMRRGRYDMPDTSRPVQRSVPAVLGALPEGAPRNRLGLAMWLVAPENPLFARVSANRAWEMLFGTGIVRTGDDFGLQGEFPSHPELLDWLAVELREGGWSMQRLLRTIMTSATYRQSSATRPEAAAIDPANRLLAWHPRQRLGAEQLRDQALYVGGLLKERLGGESVKPYQPEGLWQEVAMPTSNTRAYEMSGGDDLFRRSLYTYWKRAAPPPSMLALDAPTREYCVTRRMATNTPLQALVLWNDHTFTEAARHLAGRVLAETPDGLDGDARDLARVEAMWRRVTGRVPTGTMRAAALAALARERERWAAAPQDAVRMLATGATAGEPASADPAELASWTALSSALLASDAAIVKD